MRKTTLMTILTAAVSAGAYADINYYYGSSDNSVALGISADNSYSVAWQGTTMGSEIAGPRGADQHNSPWAANGIDAVRYAAYSFGTLIGIGSTNDINSAKLHLYFYTGSGSDTFSIVGIESGNDWDQMSCDYNSTDGAMAWSGGDFGSSLTGDYGSFEYAGQQELWWELDVTDAIKDYYAGNISGIAIYAQNASMATLNISSDENTSTIQRGGLEVDVIPEPAVASLLILCGGSLITIRRIF